MIFFSALSLYAQSDGPAVLPTLMDTTFPNTSGYTVVTVCAAACTYTSYVTALSAVSCKTVIILTAGQSFQGEAQATQTCSSGNWIISMSGVSIK